MLVLFLFLSLLSVNAGRDKSGHRRQERIFRPLVPQLLPNYTTPSLPLASEVTCNYASLACTYRAGCGSALKQYQAMCEDLVQGITSKCSMGCRHALIALISTQEGERLMQCTCDDDSCILQKSRVEPCRSEVTWNTAPDTIVSCSAATWICMADPLCSTALNYYNRNCQAMFKGGKCSRRCKNSLEILMRQNTASKLSTCFCDGTEDFECEEIRENTDNLCFNKVKVVNDTVVELPESGGGMPGSSLVVVISMLCSILNTFLGESVRIAVEDLISTLS